MTAYEPDLSGRIAEPCDVFVIGGGPGGSAVAIPLAEAGLKVVIAEKDKHPRFHIGESLLPHSLPMLEKLGVLDRVREIGVYKPGAEFISEDGSGHTVFDFARAMLDGPPHAYQVSRDRFDQLLFERAREAGAIACEETTATVISCDEGGALITTRGDDGGEQLYHADILVDASGRSTLIAKRERDKRPDPRNTSAAIFGHFRGVPRTEGEYGGNIRIYLNTPGWMWQIPLPGGITSIGLVAPGEEMARRDCGIDEFFIKRASQNPLMAKILADADLVRPMTATGNFSYRSSHAVGPGHIKVGDAFGFIDPIFSTGVHLALSSASEAAVVILKSRDNPADRARLMTRYDRYIQRRLKYISWFIYSISDRSFREMLLHPKDFLGIERAVISLLAGDFRPDIRIRSRVWLFRAIRRAIALKNRVRGNKGKELAHA